MKKKLGRKFYKKLGKFIQLSTDCTITKDDGRLVRVDMTLPIGFGGPLYNDAKWMANKLRQNDIDFTIDIVHEAKKLRRPLSQRVRGAYWTHDEIVMAGHEVAAGRDVAEILRQHGGAL